MTTPAKLPTGSHRSRQHAAPDWSLGRRQLFAATAVGLTAWLARPLQSLADDVADSSSDNGPLPYVDRIGLQLYTVRDQMKADAEGTIQAIAKAGYRQVELMSIDDDAIKIAAIARDHGLMVHSAFMDFGGITHPDRDGVISVDRTVEIAERIGLRHVVFGYIARDERDSVEKCQTIAENANRAAEKTRAAGMRMGYHNHSFEFAKLDGGAKTAFDIFIERFDPQLMDFELDVFWVKIGGEDPIAMMKKLAGRITQVHLKDLKADVGTINDEGQVPADAFQELGDGVIDMPAIMRLAKEIGVRECHVEQDQSPAPIDSINQSIQFLNQKRS
ncbi:Inosose dehydratase [Rubripirellula lacrimiformis]|uniref:Inosose dehydratase n=1 Tax=Rubripirellula lacrimiformis TaxID=1930273 RepID=A0A517N3D9_9BACT|nr:sugar phosphate isomerase/epimerase family protein [Rubripirellula lacrimiformis]QDT01647.1 Inosose dehydratase [Rubripirellula lacrimiformis]